MSETVVIALVGDPSQPGAPLDDAEWERPWDQRPKITLEVDEAETLGSVVARAASELSVALAEGATPSHVIDLGLHVPGERRATVWDMTLVDDDGRVLWTAADLRLIPYSQLVQSVAAGVVRGDPRRLYAVLREPIGNGLGVDWPTIVQAWETIDAIVVRIGAYGGAAAAIGAAYQQIQKRIRRGRKTIDANVHKWSQRGARPYDLFRFLGRPTWQSSDLARLLDCQEADAEAILALFGFAYNESDQTWHREGDEPGRLLAAAFIESAATHFEYPNERREFEARIDELLRTGERPPERTYGEEVSFLDFFELISFTVTPEGVVGHGRIGRREVHVQLPPEEMSTPGYGELVARAYDVLAREIVKLGADIGETAGLSSTPEQSEPER